VHAFAEFFKDIKPASNIVEVKVLISLEMHVKF